MWRWSLRVDEILTELIVAQSAALVAPSSVHLRVRPRRGIRLVLTKHLITQPRTFRSRPLKKVGEAVERMARCEVTLVLTRTEAAGPLMGAGRFLFLESPLRKRTP